MPELTWEAHDYTLRNFNNFLSTKLPFLVKITEGYYGMDDVLPDFSQDDLCFIQRKKTQERAILKICGRSTMISVPHKYNIKFQEVNRDGSDKPGGGSGSLEDLIRKHGMSADTWFVRPETSEQSNFLINGDKTDIQALDVLEFMDDYEEEFFVAFAVNEDLNLYPRAIVMPVYLPIRVALARGVPSGDQRHFQQIIQHLHGQGQGVFIDGVCGNKEIMLYDEEICADKAYSYVEPNKYLIPQVVVGQMIRKDSTKDAPYDNSADDAMPAPPRPPRIPIEPTPSRKQSKKPKVKPPANEKSKGKGGFFASFKRTPGETVEHKDTATTGRDSGLGASDGGTVSRVPAQDPDDEEYVMTREDKLVASFREPPQPPNNTQQTTATPAALPRKRASLPEDDRTSDNYDVIEFPADELYAMIDEHNMSPTAGTSNPPGWLPNDAKGKQKAKTLPKESADSRPTPVPRSLSESTKHAQSVTGPSSKSSKSQNLATSQISTSTSPTSESPKPQNLALGQTVPDSVTSDTPPVPPRDSQRPSMSSKEPGTTTEVSPGDSASGFSDERSYCNFVSIKDLSVERIVPHLSRLNLAKHIDTFKEQKIDGFMLSMMDKDTLKEIGFTNLESIKLLAFVERCKKEGVPFIQTKPS